MEKATELKKATAFLDYVKALVELKINKILNLDDMDSVIYADNIGKHWNAQLFGYPFRNGDWLTLWTSKLSRDLSPPDPPPRLRRWVKMSDDPNKPPRLHIKINRDDRHGTSPDLRETAQFSLFEEFENWKSHVWQPWAEKKKLQTENREPFATLMKIRRKLSQNTNLDLILGYGILEYRLPHNKFVKFPLITQKVRMRSGPKRMQYSFYPLENFSIKLETSLLLRIGISNPLDIIEDFLEYKKQFMSLTKSPRPLYLNPFQVFTGLFEKIKESLQRINHQKNPLINEIWVIYTQCRHRNRELIEIEKLSRTLTEANSRLPAFLNLVLEETSRPPEKVFLSYRDNDFDFTFDVTIPFKLTFTNGHYRVLKTFMVSPVVVTASLAGNKNWTIYFLQELTAFLQSKGMSVLVTSHNEDFLWQIYNSIHSKLEEFYLYVSKKHIVGTRELHSYATDITEFPYLYYPWVLETQIDRLEGLLYRSYLTLKGSGENLAAYQNVTTGLIQYKGKLYKASALRDFINNLGIDPWLNEFPNLSYDVILRDETEIIVADFQFPISEEEMDELQDLRTLLKDAFNDLSKDFPMLNAIADVETIRTICKLLEKPRINNSEPLYKEISEILTEMVEELEYYMGLENVHPIVEILWYCLFHLGDEPISYIWELAYKKLQGLNELKYHYNRFLQLLEKLHALSPTWANDWLNPEVSIEKLIIPYYVNAIELKAIKNYLDKSPVAKYFIGIVDYKRQQLYSDILDKAYDLKRRYIELNFVSSITKEIIHRIKTRRYRSLLRQLDRLPLAIFCPLDHIGKVFPLRLGLFDYVIITDVARVDVNTLLAILLGKKALLIPENKNAIWSDVFLWKLSYDL